MSDCFIHKNIREENGKMVCQDCHAFANKPEVFRMDNREKITGIVSRVQHGDNHKYWAVWVNGDGRRFSKTGPCPIENLFIGDTVNFTVAPQTKDGVTYWNIQQIGRTTIGSPTVGNPTVEEVEPLKLATPGPANNTADGFKAIELTLIMLTLYNPEKWNALGQAQKEDELFRIASSIMDWSSQYV